MTFADTATRLAALAALTLGWRPGEFWAATPAELALCLGTSDPGNAPPSRAEMLALIERDADARCR